MENLRKALLKLPATGSAGFEGLVALSLTEIAGVPFRLAGGGSQFGLDGKAAYNEDAICFECKRYDSQIPRAEVLTKIAELSVDDKGSIDLWVLGATTQVRAQLADDVRAHGEKSGIKTLILDWSDTGLPPLAVALAMAETRVTDFLRSYVRESELASIAVAALCAIREDAGFADNAGRIRVLLSEPTTGTAIARPANSAWLVDVFSSKAKARRVLRQPLCPGDRTRGEPAARTTLVNQVGPLMAGQPDGKILVILGEEGSGKSWLAAQSWLSLEDKPLMVVFTADDFSGTSAADDLIEMWIEKLVVQTAGRISESARNRWRRKVDWWRKGGTPDAARLVVVIDGLNQRPHSDWARLMEAMGSELDRIGGRLCVTVRTSYYVNRIRRRLQSPALEVNVPEWTDAERNAILATHGIRGDDLGPTVAGSLLNPRLLGIALELLQTAQIEELEELSVSRLLFEHMRVQEREAPDPQPAHEFARMLQDHAREVLDRVTAQQRDDLKVFEGSLEAVSDGRFFVPLEDDLTRYKIDDDGLTLALGFAVLDELRKACRNGHDLAEALHTMVEPISALDRTADAILAALTVACLDEGYSVDIGAAIVGAFAELQNPNADEFSAFAALAAKRPGVFMDAAHRICLASMHPTNFDWIGSALEGAKTAERAWSVMLPRIQTWLAHYSLAPEAGIVSHRSRDPAGQLEKERANRQNQIENNLRALSSPERELLNTLIRNDDGDLARLTRFAFTLLAGKPLRPFALAFAYWSFANALNSGYGALYKEFEHLVCLNRTDWQDTHEAILEACDLFEGADVSRTGKWALANLLQSTGDPEDAARAQVLVNELTVDTEKFEGWRLVEQYCATDPCDPGSLKPGNIAKTAENYAAIDVSEIRFGMGNAKADHFFAMARPGIVRFVPQVGVDKHREFIRNVLERSGFPLRQGVFELHHHNALVSREDAERLVARVKLGTSGCSDDNLQANERWVVSQYHRLLAFPLLSAEEQVEALLCRNPKGRVLFSLMEVAKPLDEKTFETLLVKAVRDGDERVQSVVLAFGHSCDVAVSQNARKQLEALVKSESERVRAQALGLVAKTGDEHGIEEVMKSRWDAAKITAKDGHEIWYGSCVVLEAAARRMIPYGEALDRIAPQLYGEAARRLSADAAHDLARRIDASIKSASSLDLDTAVPDIELAQQGNKNTEPPRYFASEKPSPSSNTADALQRFSESNKAFEERQRRARQAFESFKGTLTRAKAQIILDGLKIPEFDVIAAADRSLAESWCDLFLNLPKPRRRAIHNLGLLLAHSLASWDSERAVGLFAMLADSEPFVRITYGGAGITLDAMALWSAKDHPVLGDLRFDRLDKAGNNDEIALEVLAALWNDKQDLLTAYIEARLRTGQPSEIARAVMVAGLSEQNEFNDGILARYNNTPGFIGRAQVAAMYAYERNIWSKHWFTLMHGVQKPEDFWRYSVLFEKIVDGRFDVWASDPGDAGQPYRLFWPSVEDRVRHRQKKWRDVRKRKLFGAGAPLKVFVYSR